MSIDFATLQALEIPEGVVAKIEDSSGRVLWSVRGTKVVLAVKKWTDTTYAGETEREGEVFIAFDIYPNPYGVVKVTYNGHTKTISDTTGVSKPNAQTVYFGTLYGESDGVEILESATLTIEGGFKQFAVGSYTKKSKYEGLNATGHCGCVTSVVEWGNITRIADNAFYDCAGLTSVSIPNGVMSIGMGAFYNCAGLTSIDMPDSVTSIDGTAFYNCTGLTSIHIPNNLTSILGSTFYNCTGLTSITIPDSVTSIGIGAFQNCTGLTSITFGSGVQTIGEDAFYMPTDVSSNIGMHNKTIILPSALTAIGARAFRYNDYSGVGESLYYTYIGTAIMLSKTPPTLGEEAFGASGTTQDGTTGNKMTIIVPKGCSEAYKAAEGWASLRSVIVEES